MKSKAYVLFFSSAFVLALLAGASVLSKDEPRNAEKGFALIELYTSEGCSSCPSADALVARVAKENANRAVYVLGYHVDYWNRLGWKDKFSRPEFSKRQRQYAFTLKSQVYTPQIVVNGKSAFVGSDNRALQKAIVSGLDATPTRTLSLRYQPGKSNQAMISYNVSGPAGNDILYLALVEKYAVTDVKQGENSGRRLQHVNIVERLQAVPLNRQSGSVELSMPQVEPGNMQVVGFVQEASTGEIKSAARCALRVM